VLHGTKTVTARPTFSWGIPRNVFDDAQFDIDDRADLFDNTGRVHARLRITDAYTCRFDATPEKLWRAEAEPSAQAFRDSHVEDSSNLTLTNDAMLTAIHFERLVQSRRQSRSHQVLIPAPEVLPTPSKSGSTCHLDALLEEGGRPVPQDVRASDGKQKSSAN
jgi:hypothetical protein